MAGEIWKLQLNLEDKDSIYNPGDIRMSNVVNSGENYNDIVLRLVVPTCQRKINFSEEVQY